MSPNSTRIGKWESKLPSNNSEFDVATAEIVSTEPRLHLAKNAPGLMWEQVQAQGP